MLDVTSANLTLAMVVEELFPQGVVIEGFSQDASLSPENMEFTETRRGIDGKMVAGVIKNICSVTITLEANSPSLKVFETIRDAMNANNRPYEVTLTANYPALGKTKTFYNGVLRSGATMPQAQRTLMPTTWVFEFEGVR